MSYEEKYNDAISEGKVKELSADYKKWEKSGDTILGSYESSNSVVSKMGSQPYNQYLFNTDDGMVKFALGRATDNASASLMEFGGVYCITFKGQEKIGSGRKINTFEILEIDKPTVVKVGGEADEEF